MSLPELYSNPPSGASTPWALAQLSQAITTTPAAGTVEQYTVTAAAPAALRGVQGRFTVQIGGEYMQVLVKADGSSPWYFVRGAEGSTPTTHNNGDAIYHIPTAGSIRGVRRPSQMRSRLNADLERNFWVPGPTDNPTITLGAANAASAITGSASLAGYTALPNDARIRVSGGPGPLVQAGTVWPDTLKYTITQAVTRAAGYGNGISYAIYFDVYCSKIEISMFGLGTTPNIYVNGVKQTGVTALPNDGNQHNYLLDWTATTGLGFRRIRVEVQTGATFLGFYYLATEDIMPVDVNQSPLRMITTGDSWTDGTGTTDGISSFSVLAGHMLGIDDVWQAGIGGSGYLNNSAQGNKIGTRLSTDIFPYLPDILLLCAGSDDTSFTPTQVATEATNDWLSIMGKMPDCLLVVMGPYACPFGGGSPNYSGFATYNTALKNAAAACGVPFIDTIGEKWITGTGYVGATNNTGTSDTLIGSDGVHPTQTGHNFMARKTAQKLMNILATL